MNLFFVAIDAISDIEVLRSYLRDTTDSLHSAAQMGLGLAQQNQELQQRLDEMADSQEELKQRLLMVERDRQWFQQQSIRIDQMRANLVDLQTKSEKASRRMVSDQRVSTLEKTLDRLREDMEVLARNVEETNGTDKQVGLKTVYHTVREVVDSVKDVRQTVEQVNERVEQNDIRVRGMVEDLGKQVMGLRKRVDGLENQGREAQEVVETVVARQDDMEASLKSVIHEYNEMLNEHEQTLRILGDAQSVLESQVAARQPPVYTLQEQQRRRISPSSKSRNSGRSGASIVQNTQNIELRDIEEQHHSVSAPPPPLAGYGESLGDIFAEDHAVVGNSGVDIGAFLPSPPLSTMSGGDQQPPLSSSLLAGNMAHTRKAASVIGTPGDRPKQRTRPRMSSFSKLAVTNQHSPMFPALSPTKHSGFGNNILSATAHVGVGWGNYWQARRDRLQFDIQRRLGLSAGTTALIGSKVKSNSTAEEELGIED
ncbi:hypothetical protein LPJ57_003374 [Coemansia sp. RSA 486]|nr:hypothetical protein LPJ57_003374 [Coemansia sp. RSA 486]KAJ2237336.1 hypothetical protein IWW45_001022 [Coemansia sp. RSA 485]